MTLVHSRELHDAHVGSRDRDASEHGLDKYVGMSVLVRRRDMCAQVLSVFAHRCECQESFNPRNWESFRTRQVRMFARWHMKSALCNIIYRDQAKAQTNLRRTQSTAYLRARRLGQSTGLEVIQLTIPQHEREEAPAPLSSDCQNPIERENEDDQVEHQHACPYRGEVY